jgi:hypothetical protein
MLDKSKVVVWALVMLVSGGFAFAQEPRPQTGAIHQEDLLLDSYSCMGIIIDNHSLAKMHLL